LSQPDKPVDALHWPPMIIGFGNKENQERPQWGLSPTNAVRFHLRDAFRSGDIWLAHSRRFADLKQTPVPTAKARVTPGLAVPFDPADWLADRKARMATGLKAFTHVCDQFGPFATQTIPATVSKPPHTNGQGG